jgi:hypothetical protein
MESERSLPCSKESAQYQNIMNLNNVAKISNKCMVLFTIHLYISYGGGAH